MIKERNNSEAIIGCLILLLIAPFGAAWSGYVLSILWAWFVVPTFEGAPILSIPAAIGLAMVVSYLTRHASNTEDNRSATEKTGAALGMALLYPALALGFGYIVHLFM